MMIELTSYERVQAALRHKEPDRIPFDLGGSMVTGINVNALRELRKYLGFFGEPVVKDEVTQMAETGDDVGELLKVDVRNVGPIPAAGIGLARDLGVQDGHHRLIDEFGIGWQMPMKNGHYHDLYISPLANAETVQDIENYPWPDPLDPA